MGAVCGGPVDSNTKEIKEQKSKQRTAKKVLLLGAGGSGKSTLFKQLKIIHGGGFTKAERVGYTEVISYNVLDGMRILIEKCKKLSEAHPKQFEHLQLPVGNDYRKATKRIKRAAKGKLADEILREREQQKELEKQRQKKEEEEQGGCVQQVQELQKPQHILEYAIDEKVKKGIKLLWSTDSIKNCYEARSNFQLLDSVKYFFEHIDRITQQHYVPSEEDVLRARLRTTGIVEQQFLIKNKYRYTIVDVGGQRIDRRKWTHCFQGATAVIFVASLSAYDQTLVEDDYTNRMKEAMNLFGQICNHPTFKNTPIILFLNKRDIFQEKVETYSVKGVKFFEDYKGDTRDWKQAAIYIKDQFMKRNKMKIWKGGDQANQQLYAHFTNSLNRKNVEKVFWNVQHSVMTTTLKEAALISDL